MTSPYFLHFCNYFPLEQDYKALHLNNFEFPLPKYDLHQVSLKLDSWSWKKDLKNFSLYSYSFAFISF
jgi:hypothetical protein